MPRFEWGIFFKMIKMKFFILCLFFPFSLFSQQTLKGIITDSKTKLPVEYASVYFDGTTIGTITDVTGAFILPTASIPGKLIVSHVSYVNVELNLTKDKLSFLEISINPNEIRINEVVVEDQNLRSKNLAYFNEIFLGKDKWGDYSFLLNDSVLIFQNEEIDSNNIVLNITGRPDVFKVHANQPLKIQLPLLGYELLVDLIEFETAYSIEFKAFICNSIGSCYYKPVAINSKNKIKKIEKHRAEVYYNSKLHFCRSLKEGQLGENGYRIQEAITENNKVEYKDFDINKFVLFDENGIIIRGLKNRNLYVYYYSLKNWEPVAINNSLAVEMITESRLFFISDSCLIQKDGKVPDNSIRFGPSIGNKKIGASLPFGYYPDSK